jgi:hypothetical protein
VHIGKANIKCMSSSNEEHDYEAEITIHRQVNADIEDLDCLEQGSDFRFLLF